MKECSSCKTKGLFLKLKNSMCEKCSIELNSLEEEYENVLDKIVLKEVDSNEAIILLNKLAVKLRKFEDVNSLLKPSDCFRIIEGLEKDKESKLSPFKNENTYTDNNLSLDMDGKQDLYIDVDKDLSNKKEFIDENITSQSKGIEPVVKNISDNTHISSTLTAIDSDANINGTIVLHEKGDISSLKDINNDSSSTLVEENHTNNLNTTSLIDEISATDIDEIGKILNIISDVNLSIEDLTKYTFMLKDNYLNKLSKNNIPELNGFNIKKIIDDNLNNISAKLKCKKHDIYGFFNYVSIAIQTTGQNTPHSEIIEIYALKISYGEIIGKFHTFVNPMKSISLSVENETGISNIDVENSPTIDVALAELSDFCKDLKLVSYNSNFTMKFINHYTKLYNIKNSFKNDECILKLYRTRYKSYHGAPTKKFDIYSICYDILPEENIIEINSEKSKCSCMSYSVFKLYEILKYRYK